MKAEEFYLNIINNLRDGVYFVNRDRIITFWNGAAEEITGYAASEIVGHACQENLLKHIDEEGRPLCVVGCPLFASIVDGKQRKHDVFLRHKDGHRIPVHVNIFPMLEDGEIVGAIEVFTPNSPIVYEDSLIENLSNMAMLDALTGLPNRRYLQSFLDYKLKEYQRFEMPFAVLFLDIDNFRVFNNTYGHDIGDLVLQTIAKTVKQNMRKTDMFGRWGGEEFLGVFAIKARSDSRVIGEKIRVLIANTEIPNDPPLSVTASIGVAVFGEDDTIETIIEKADALMYVSKNEGKNRVSCEEQ